MLLWLIGAPGLAAQTVPPATPEGFVPMSEIANREVLPATPLVFYAYAFVWLALIGYVFVLWRKLGRVEADLEAIRRRLGQNGSAR
jgi:hypothetical protein